MDNGETIPLEDYIEIRKFCLLQSLELLKEANIEVTEDAAVDIAERFEKYIVLGPQKEE